MTTKIIIFTARSIASLAHAQNQPDTQTTQPLDAIRSKSFEEQQDVAGLQAEAVKTHQDYWALLSAKQLAEADAQAQAQQNQENKAANRQRQTKPQGQADIAEELRQKQLEIQARAKLSGTPQLQANEQLNAEKAKQQEQEQEQETKSQAVAIYCQGLRDHPTPSTGSIIANCAKHGH